MSYLKPEEAKQKFCPYRVGLTLSNCVGDRCMSWRQQSVYTTPNGFTKEPTDKGYCGLAGKPD